MDIWWICLCVFGLFSFIFFSLCIMTLHKKEIERLTYALHGIYNVIDPVLYEVNDDSKQIAGEWELCDEPITMDFVLSIADSKKVSDPDDIKQFKWKLRQLWFACGGPCKTLQEIVLKSGYNEILVSQLMFQEYPKTYIAVLASDKANELCQHIVLLFVYYKNI